jgi:hypothetical protein
MRCLLARIRPWVQAAGFGGVVIALTLAWTIDRAMGEEVRLISPHDASTVEVNRALFVPGDPVPEIYGVPLSTPVRVIAPDSERILHPREDPALVLLRVDKRIGENPLQARTVWLFAKAAALVLGLIGVAALAFPRSCVVVSLDEVRHSPRVGA